MTPRKEPTSVCEQEYKEHNPFEELLKIEGLPRKDPAPPEKRWRVVGLVYGFRWVEVEFEEEVEREVTKPFCTRDHGWDVIGICYERQCVVQASTIVKETVIKREKVRQRVVTAVKIELS